MHAPYLEASNPPFLHTLRDLNLDDEKACAWEYAKGIQCTLCALMSREEKCLEILFMGTCMTESGLKRT